MSMGMPGCGWERWAEFYHILIAMLRFESYANEMHWICTFLHTHAHCKYTYNNSKQTRSNQFARHNYTHMSFFRSRLSSPPFVVFTLILIFFFTCCCLLSYTWYSQSLTRTSIIRIAPWHAMNAMDWYACLLCSTRQRTIIKLLYLP